MVFLFSISLVFGQNEERVKELIKTEGKIKEEIKDTKEELKIQKEELKSVKDTRMKLEGSNVSDRAKESFNDDFGNNTDVIWKRGEFYDTATFTKDGKIMKAHYDYDSQLIGTTWNVIFSDLPADGQKKINEKYKDYEVGEIIFYDDNEPVDVDFFIYESPFKHEDNYFVELVKEAKHIILKVNKNGDISFFKNFKRE